MLLNLERADDPQFRCHTYRGLIAEHWLGYGVPICQWMSELAVAASVIVCNNYTKISPWLWLGSSPCRPTQPFQRSSDLKSEGPPRPLNMGLGMCMWLCYRASGSRLHTHKYFNNIQWHCTDRGFLPEGFSIEICILTLGLEHYSIWRGDQRQPALYYACSPGPPTHPRAPPTQ